MQEVTYDPMGDAGVMAVGSAAFSADTVREKLGIGRAGERAEQTPDSFRDWAEERLEGLREDFDSVDRGLDGEPAERREKTRGRISELKERVSRAEGRLEGVGDHNDKKAWKAREDIRDEIKDVGQDFEHVRRDLKGQ